MAFESGYKSTLATKLNPWDTSLTVATPPTITAGRLYLKSGGQEEWIEFTWLSGNTLTWLSRNLSKTAVPAVSVEPTGWYTWTAWTVVRIVAMHDQITGGNMDTSNFAPSSWSGDSIVFSSTTYTRSITPTEDFVVSCGTVVPGMSYLLEVNTWVAYAMTLGTGITNPYGESLELTTNKATKVVFLATSDSTLEVWAVRTAS